MKERREFYGLTLGNWLVVIGMILLTIGQAGFWFVIIRMAWREVFK